MFRTALNTFDRLVVWAMDTFGIKFARLAVGIVFIWFGALKMVGDLSPAYDLVAATIYWLTPEIIIPLIGLWEVAIGVAFLFPPLTRLALVLLAGQMPATFLPLVLLPAVCFTVFPFGLTLEGQYIIKNLVIIACALIIGGTALRKENPAASAIAEPLKAETLTAETLKAETLRAETIATEPRSSSLLTPGGGQR